MLSLKRDELKSSISPALQAAGNGQGEAGQQAAAGSEQGAAAGSSRQWVMGSRQQWAVDSGQQQWVLNSSG